MHIKACMDNRTISLGLSLLTTLLLNLTSCTGGYLSGTGPVITDRLVFPVMEIEAGATVVGNTVTGQAPLDIRYSVNAQYGTHDAGRFDEVTRKIEANYGEGGGWQDVSADSYEGVPILHSYTVPGSYTFDLRVTYADGEIVYSMQKVMFVIEVSQT